jgi:hypothetical protein
MLAQLVKKLKRADLSQAGLTINRVSHQVMSISSSPTPDRFTVCPNQTGKFYKHTGKPFDSTSVDSFGKKITVNISNKRTLPVILIFFIWMYLCMIKVCAYNFASCWYM